MDTDDVIRALDSFAPSDDDVATAARLYEIFEGFCAQADRARAVPAMFAAIERYPEADLGSPGPFVHELEAIPGYETSLRESVLRKPTYLAVWMVNRILNVEANQKARAGWMHLLEVAVQHPCASHSVRDTAARFIAHQTGA